VHLLARHIVLALLPRLLQLLLLLLLLLTAAATAQPASSATVAMRHTMRIAL
jgi:hypothetical protein